MGIKFDIITHQFMLEFVDSDLYFVQDKNNFINPLLQIGSVEKSTGSGSGSGGPKITGSGSGSSSLLLGHTVECRGCVNNITNDDLSV